MYENHKGARELAEGPCHMTGLLGDSLSGPPGQSCPPHPGEPLLGMGQLHREKKQIKGLKHAHKKVDEICV